MCVFVWFPWTMNGHWLFWLPWKPFVSLLEKEICVLTSIDPNPTIIFQLDPQARKYIAHKDLSFQGQAVYLDIE